jgi:hypothetical protein
LGEVFTADWASLADPWALLPVVWAVFLAADGASLADNWALVPVVLVLPMTERCQPFIRGVGGCWAIVG